MATSSQDGQELVPLLDKDGVRLTVEDTLATVTLTNPAKRNAQSPALWRALAEAGRLVPGSVRVVVLRGEGKSFSAGLDRQMFTPEGIEGEPSFIDLARGAQWVIHNAPFDLAFLDRELKLAGLPCCADLHAGVVDTLALARELYPGKRNSLDALCERFSIDNTGRTLHGALLDTQLLAEVYLAMTRGQESLTIDIAAAPLMAAAASGAIDLAAAYAAMPLKVITPTAAEAAAHRDYLAGLEKESRGHCVWLHQAAAAEPVAA